MDPVHLADFAAAVRAALPWLSQVPTERFGSRKCFVSAVFRALARQGYDVGTLDAFKARLVACNREGLLSLARADLVAAMPAGTVAASEIADRGATFHFVVDETARDPWERAAVAS